MTVLEAGSTGERRHRARGHAASAARIGGYRVSRLLGRVVVTSVHQLDDGAWLSVDDTREVNVGDLWPVVVGFCDCPVTDLLAEGFVEVSVDGRSVEARVAGQCIACGASGVTGWLELGRVVDGRFRPVDPTRVHLPPRRRR